MSTDALSSPAICDVSLNSISDSRVKELFLCCCIFAEGLVNSFLAEMIVLLMPTDQRIPSKIMILLHAASVELSENANTQTVSASTIKMWIRLLVKRSLLIEAIKGSVSLHGSLDHLMIHT